MSTKKKRPTVAELEREIAELKRRLDEVEKRPLPMIGGETHHHYHYHHSYPRPYYPYGYPWSPYIYCGAASSGSLSVGQLAINDVHSLGNENYTARMSCGN